MLDTIQYTIEKYCIEPIIYDTGYNYINKIILLTILLFSLYLLLKILTRLDIKLDNSIIIAAVPYIIFGSTLRVLQDSGKMPSPLNYLLITPIYYELILIITTFFMVFAKVLAPRLNIQDWRILFSGIGIVLTLFNIALLLSIQDSMRPVAFLMIFSFGGGLSLIIYAIGRHFSISFITDKLNAIIIFSFMLNASSNYIATEFFGYYLKSVGTLFGNNIHLNLISLIPSSIIVLSFLWFLDVKWKNNDTLKNIIKLLMLFIWMTSAIRGTIRIVLGY